MRYQDLRIEDQIDIDRRQALTRFKTIPVTLTDAQTSWKKFSFSGNFIYLIDSSDAGVTIDLKFAEGEDSGNFDYATLKQGLGFISPFEHFWLRWSAQAAKTATFLIGTEAPGALDIIDNRSAIVTTEILTDILDAEIGTTSPIQWDNDTIGTTAAELAAEQTERRSLQIQADADNTNNIYVGFDNSVDSTQYGVKLAAGQSYSFEKYQGAVWIYADAAAQAYSVIEL